MNHNTPSIISSAEHNPTGVLDAGMPYQTPTLTKLGTVQQLTAGSGFSGGDADLASGVP